MLIQDSKILIKKILVGFLIYIVPLALISGGLWLIKNLLIK